MREEVRLSKRLLAVAGMVTDGSRVCDVGCDHGFVSVYLVQKGISPRVIAMDVKEGPLQAAKEHIEEWALTGYIETRLSDGVSALGAGEADTLICAGMGGRLILKILEEGKEKLPGMKELILQPQSDLQAVREYLRGQSYRIAEEHMVLEDGKYYPMIKACPAERVFETEGGYRIPVRLADRFGPILLERRDMVLKEYLQREHRICMEILGNLRTNGREIGERQQEILDKMKDVEAALSYYEQ